MAPRFGITELRLRGFRSARDLRLRPGAVCALVGEAGAGRVVELVPDFEGIAGLHGHAHKPEHAWRRFIDITSAQVPEPLLEAVARVRSAAGA